MNIIPAIDLKNGKCVRLLKGDFEQVTEYPVDPIRRIQNFAKNDAKLCHIVDLDAAKNSTLSQTEKIIEIAQSTRITVQAGGGIRNAKQIKHLLNNGIDRVVIGSLAVTQPEKVSQWLNIFGRDRIVIALDVRTLNQSYCCAVQAWQQDTDITIWQCLDNYPNLQYLLCTDIERDGSLSGPNLPLYQEIKKRYPELSLQASGGVSSLDDIQQLSIIKLDAVIIGKALYENKFTLEEAISC